MSIEPEKLLVTAELYDEALVFCNARRAEIGLEPITELPAGNPSSKSCPCASSAPGLFVAVATWWFEYGTHYDVGHPTRFVNYFDRFAKTGVLTLPVREEQTNV